MTPDRVAAVLGMTPGNVREIATGKVGLSTTYWRRVLALLEPEEP